MTTAEDRTLSLICWLFALVPGIGILSPIIFLIVGRRRPFVFANAAQCLVMIVGWTLILWLVIFLTCGLGRFLWVVPLVFGILGAVKAYFGEVFEPPVTGPAARGLFGI